MGIQEELDVLFEKWKKALDLQMTERFIPDGIAGDEDAYKKDRVLYILKESHLKGEPPEDNCKHGYFWFKDQVKSPKPHRITKRIKAMQEAIPKKGGLTSVAYMNINKRGGGAETDPKALKAHAQSVASFIKEEIRILAPELIICCGCYGIISDAAILGEDPRLVDMWHPSYYAVNCDKYIQKYKSAREFR